MYSLIRKEVRELALPFLLALAVLFVPWFLGAIPERTLLGPVASDDFTELALCAFCSALIGYWQFAGERRRGTQVFLAHRGTGVGGLFAAKVAVGSLAALSLAAVPPVAHWLWNRFATPLGPIVQSERLVAWCVFALFAFPCYGAGAFAAAQRRARWSWLVALAATYGALVAGLWGGIELMRAGLGWFGPLLAIALVAAALLALAWQMLRTGDDRELALPARVSLGLALASPILAVAPVLAGLLIVRKSLPGVQPARPVLVQNRATHEAALLVRDADGAWRRTDGKPVVGNEQRLRGSRPWGDRTDLRLLWAAESAAGRVAPNPPPPQLLEELHWQLEKLTAYYYLARWSWMQVFDLSDSSGWIEDPQTVLVWDPRGRIRCFRSPPWQDPNDSRAPEPDAWVAEEYELSKPGGGSLSPAANVIGWQEHSALLHDPADGSLLRFVRHSGEVRLEPAGLPGGDRLVRLESLYSADAAVIGHLEPADLLFVGERGRYVRRESGFVDFDGPEPKPEPDSTTRAHIPWPYRERGLADLILAEDVPSRIELRVASIDSDPLAPGWSVVDARTEEILFAWHAEPLAQSDPWSWLAIEGIYLLRPPAATAWNFLREDGTASGARPGFAQAFLSGPDGRDLFAGGRRLGLATASIALGLALAVWVLRRTSTPIAARLAWAIMVATFGVPVFALFRLCESRAERAAVEHAPARRPVAVAQPLIQSA